MYIKDSTATEIKNDVIKNIASRRFLPAETRGQLSVLYLLRIIDDKLYNDLLETVNKEDLENGET